MKLLETYLNVEELSMWLVSIRDFQNNPFLGSGQYLQTVLRQGTAHSKKQLAAPTGFEPVPPP